MKQYIFILLSCCIFFFSCEETGDLPVFEDTEAQTEMGKQLLQSGLITKVHSESLTTPITGVKEFHIDFLSFSGYLEKIHIYEVDLTVSDLHVAVCTSENRSSTSSFSTQKLSEQVKLVDADTARIYGAINGGSFASANSRPYGILVKDSLVLRKAFTATGNNAHPLFFAINKDKKAIMGKAEDLDNTVMFADLRDALGGKEWLIQNGVLAISSNDKISAKTVVGAIGEDKVILLVVDGGSYFISNGMLSYDISKILLSLGVDNAILLNDGIYSTFISRDESGLFVNNFPLDNGAETENSHGLIIVKR